MAYGTQRRGIRSIPDTQQPYDDRRSAARAQRRRERRARNGPTSRADVRRGLSGISPGSHAHLVDISLAFATTVLTNAFNRINDTEIDFSAVV